jgi:putative membrane protein
VRLLRPGLLALGVALLVVLVVQNEPRSILASIRELSWRLGLVVCFPAVLVAVLDALGWRFAFLEDRVPLWRLTIARLAGEAFNLTTPTGAVGGEVVKAWLIRSRVPLAEAVPSVIVAKTTITIAQGLFLLLGIVLGWHLFASGSSLLIAMELLLIVEVVALSFFVAAQTRGFLARSVRPLRWLGIYAATASGRLQQVDDALARFYRTKPGRLALSILFHFLAWLLGAIETYLIMTFLGIPVTLLTATVIEALGASIRFATFVIPASLGVLEGGYAALFGVLGLGSSAGLSFTLVRRMRELVWILVGLVVFGVMRTDARPRVASEA